jgi:hypothetical protein
MKKLEEYDLIVCEGWKLFNKTIIIDWLNKKSHRRCCVISHSCKVDHERLIIISQLSQKTLSSFALMRFLVITEDDHLKEKITSSLSLINYRVYEAFNFGKPFFKNYYHHVQIEKPPLNPSNLYGTLKGTPALICGAGPSLKEWLPFLKEISQRCLVFTAGSAAYSLSKYGIPFHGAFVIDPLKRGYQNLALINNYEVPLFYSFRMCYETLSLFSQEKIYLSIEQEYSALKKLHCKSGLRGFGSVGVSSTTVALSFLNSLGCHPIFFAGVDLKGSYNDSELINPPHKGTHGEWSVEKAILSQKLVSMKDIGTTNNNVNLLGEQLKQCTTCDLKGWNTPSSFWTEDLLNCVKPVLKRHLYDAFYSFSLPPIGIFFEEMLTLKEECFVQDTLSAIEEIKNEKSKSIT